jgi:cyanophycinase
MAQTTGPENGHLVIVGGAMKSEAIVQEFIDLAGGLNASNCGYSNCSRP